MTKILILIILVSFSVYIAFIRVSALSERLKKNKKMLTLSEKIRKNYRTQMLSPITLCRELTGRDIYTSEQAVMALKEEFSGAFGADEFCDGFSALFDAFEDELEGIFDRLSEISSNAHRLSAAEYERVKESVYILYPGIACIVSIIIM